MDLALRAGPDLVSPNSHGGRAAGRPRVPRRRRTWCTRCTSSASAARARRSSPTRRAATRWSGATTSARLYELRDRAARAGFGDRRRRRLPGRIPRRPYTGRAHGDALRFAVACGAESTQHLGAGVLDPRAAERLEQRGRRDASSRSRRPSTPTPDPRRPQRFRRRRSAFSPSQLASRRPAVGPLVTSAVSWPPPLTTAVRSPASRIP